MLLVAFRKILLASFVLTSCQNRNTTKELLDRFYTNKPYLNSIISKLQNDKRLDSLFDIGPEAWFPDIKTIYPNEFILLEKIGIIGASSSHYGICKTCPRSYCIKTNWPSEYPIYLIYNFSDSTENIKGFYKKDKYKNETWGLGDDWKMFRFVDTITDVKY